jgi:hypothetical protein
LHRRPDLSNNFGAFSRPSSKQALYDFYTSAIVLFGLLFSTYNLTGEETVVICCVAKICLILPDLIVRDLKKVFSPAFVPFNKSIYCILFESQLCSAEFKLVYRFLVLLYVLYLEGVLAFDFTRI